MKQGQEQGDGNGCTKNSLALDTDEEKNPYKQGHSRVQSMKTENSTVLDVGRLPKPET